MRAGILVWEAEQVVSTGFPLQPSCSELPFEPRLSSKSNLPSPQAVPCNNLIMLGIDWYLNCYMNMMTQIWWMRRVSCSHQFLFPVVLKRMNYRILYPSNFSPRGLTLTFNRWAVIIFPMASIASHPDDLTQVTFRIQETTPRLVGQYNRVTCCTCKTRNCRGNEHLKNDCDVNQVFLIWTLLYCCYIMSNPEMSTSHWKHHTSILMILRILIHGWKRTWTSRQHTDRSVPVSSWFSQEPNSNHPPGQYQHCWRDHDFKWHLWQTTWNCSMSPRAIGWAVPSLPPSTTCSFRRCFHQT